MGLRDNEGEKQVSLGEVPREKAISSLSGAQDMAIPNHAFPDFKREKFYSFQAEYGLVGEDIVIHFFLPEQANLTDPKAHEAWQEYWLKTFPSKIEPVALAHFETGYPRLTMKYTEEVVSWWFKARGFSTLLDPTAFAHEFLVKADEALRAGGASAPPANN